MKKIYAMLAAFMLILSMLMLAGVPSASAEQPKKIDICHATDSKKNPYVVNNVSTDSVDKMGHDTHNDDKIPGDGINGDVIPSFTYTDRDENGDLVTLTYPGKNWPAGEAFLKNGCEAPDGRTPVTVPEPNYKDECGIKNDVDLAVAPGEGYTVGPLVEDGRTQSITVTLNNLDDYVWADGTEGPKTFSHTFTSVDCDLPETGGEAQYNTTLGLLALLGIGGLATALLLSRRKRS